MAILPGVRRLAERLPTDMLLDQLASAEARRGRSVASRDLADTLRAVLDDRTRAADLGAAEIVCGVAIYRVGS